MPNLGSFPLFFRYGGAVIELIRAEGGGRDQQGLLVSSIRATVHALGVVAHDVEGKVCRPQPVAPRPHTLVVPVPEQLYHTAPMHRVSSTRVNRRFLEWQSPDRIEGGLNAGAFPPPV
jgi:hypothetical protein